LHNNPEVCTHKHGTHFQVENIEPARPPSRTLSNWFYSLYVYVKRVMLRLNETRGGIL
jgi:hypothetical protein